MHVGVIGAGLMGRGIALVAALHGHETILVDIVSSQLEQAKKEHGKILKRGVEKKGGGTFSLEEVCQKIVYTEDLHGLSSVEVCIEAVVEDLSVKQKLFSDLETICPSEAIFGTNTSSLSITQIASRMKHRERVIGIHFFNPAHKMQLVELIRGVHTSEECFEKSRLFCEGMGKIVVESHDSPGFITSRLGLVLMLEAVFCLQEGVATKEDIDQAMKLGYNHPMGPLQLADLVGLDTLLHVSEVLFTGFQDPKYRPPWLLKQMVQAGKLGRKSGEGFYPYAK